MVSEYLNIPRFPTNNLSSHQLRLGNSVAICAPIPRPRRALRDSHKHMPLECIHRLVRLSSWNHAPAWWLEVRALPKRYGSWSDYQSQLSCLCGLVAFICLHWLCMTFLGAFPVRCCVWKRPERCRRHGTSFSSFLSALAWFTDWYRNCSFKSMII